MFNNYFYKALPSLTTFIKSWHPFLWATESFQDALHIPNHDTVTCYQWTCLPVECSYRCFWSSVQGQQCSNSFEYILKNIQGKSANSNFLGGILWFFSLQLSRFATLLSTTKAQFGRKHMKNSEMVCSSNISEILTRIWSNDGTLENRQNQLT